MPVDALNGIVLGLEVASEIFHEKIQMVALFLRQDVIQLPLIFNSAHISML